jgi:hypothetical protein
VFIPYLVLDERYWSPFLPFLGYSYKLYVLVFGNDMAFWSVCSNYSGNTGRDDLSELGKLPEENTNYVESASY